jgi:predicted PurR-regulated permease PerM
MRDQEVSPGFFLGVMGLVGAAVVKNPTAKVQAYKAGFSAIIDALGALILSVLKFGLIVAGVCLAFWCLHKMISWIRKLDKDRKQLTADVAQLKEGLDWLKTWQGRVRSSLVAVDSRLSTIDAEIQKLAKGPEVKKQESKSASLAAVSEIVGG